MPKVSVIIPTYNRASLVRCAITTVLNQTFPDFELIVVDNGSADNTRQVVTGFADQRVKYLRIETNNGVSPARNLAILNSSGQYIAFLDDDDEWLSDKLDLQVRLMHESPTGVAGVYTGYIVIDRFSGRAIRRVIPRHKGNLFDQLCIANCIGTASTVLLRKDCFEKVGLFDDDIRYAEDYDLWIRISRHFEFECIKKSLVRYSVHSNSATSDYGLVIRGLEAQDRKYGSWFASNRKGYSDRCLALGVLYCYTGDFELGRRAILRAINGNPFALRHYFYLFMSLFCRHNFKRFKDGTDTFTSKLRSFLSFRSSKGEISHCSK